MLQTAIAGSTAQVLIAGDLIPATDDTYSLGYSNQQWAHAYFGSNSVYIGGIPIRATTSNTLTITGNLVPTDSLTYSFGTTGARWKEMYIGPGSLNIAGPTGTTGAATLGSDAGGVAYTELGFATPFVNIGPAQLTPTAVGGWQIGPTGTQGSNNYDLIARQVDPSGAGLTGPTYSLLTQRVQGSGGGYVFVVDKLYGNDTTAALTPYQTPFLTITAALTAAGAVATASNPVVVRVNPGIYEEAITIPSYVTVRGASVPAVFIQKSSVTSITTVVTMGTNTRLEDVTVNVTTATAGITVTGVYFPSGTQQMAKVRTSVISVTSVANATCYGVLSSGSSALTANSIDAFMGCTITVMSSGSSPARAVYLNGSNRLSMRNTNIYCNGAGTDCTAAEINDASGVGVLQIKTSSLNGSIRDIARTNGVLLLQAVDLINGTTDGNSFTSSSVGGTQQFGILGNIGAGTDYLVPGTVNHGDLPSTPFNITFDQTIVPYYGVFKAQNALTGINTAVFNVYKNSTSNTPFMTATLNSTTSNVIVNNKSATITTADSIIVSVTTTNIGTGNVLLCTLGIL